MKVAPFRALTHVLMFREVGRVCVEMKVAPFRALTQSSCRTSDYLIGGSRNEGRPIQGIDTNLRHYSFAQIDKNS